jgi:hypothetical protein
MQNVVPAQVLSKRSRRLLYAAVAVLFAAIFAFTVAILLKAIPFVVPSNPSFASYDAFNNFLFILGGILLVAAALMALRAVTWRQDNTLAQSTGEYLAGRFDSRFIFIRNISKRSIGYIDAVLVGPPGVLVFRICDQKGVYYNEGNKWMRQKDQGVWRTMAWSPTDEAIADIKKVRDYLVSKGVQQPQVFGVVVFIGQPPSTVVTSTTPTVPVAQLPDLELALAGTYLSKMERHDAPTVTKMAEALYL